MGGPPPDLWCIPDVLEHHATVRPDAVALVVGDERLTYGELRRQSNRVANALVAEGVGVGSRFAVVDKNRLAFYPAKYGGSTAGGVHVAVNWRLAPAEMAHIIDDADVEVLFVGAELFDKVAEVEDRLGGVRRIVALDDHPRWVALEEWLAPFGDDDPRVGVTGSSLAFQFYTSGTTGLPKGVPVSHAQCFTQVRGLGPPFGLGPDSVTLMVMPTFHIAGSQWSLQGIYHGARTVVLREFEPVAVLEAIEAHGVTHALLVPAMIKFVLEPPEAATTDFSTLRTVSYGGSPIAPSVLAEALDVLGCQFFQSYGMTEAAGAITVLGPEDHDLARPALLASAGKPVPWCELRIADLETGAELPTGEVGEICIRSPSNMAGYWKVPNEVSGVFRDGWLRTGDAGYFDDDGYLYLHDRVKDMIVSGGENVYPTEVENVLVRHPAVNDVAVIAVPSDRWGEAVHAVVVLEGGATVTADELVAFARPHLAGFKLPKSIEVVDELPRNPSGKVLKQQLRATHWSGHQRAVG